MVRPAQAPPDGWEQVERVRVGDDEVAHPAGVLERLHDRWFARHPVVVELACAPESLRVPERVDVPVYLLDAGFEFSRERLHFLVWANNYDARTTQLVWWHGRKAARRIAGVTVGGPADILGPDGAAYFIDGGPQDPPELPTGTPVVHRFNAEAGELLAVRHEPPAADLAVDQLAAVCRRVGAARVIAPAGSGKTRVLTERVRHLLDRGSHPSTLTAVAFNTRAAQEMRNRLPELVTRQGPQVRTLNSLGLWVCNTFGPDGHLGVLEESGVRDLIQEVFPVKRVANTDTVAPYLDALSAVRLGLASPERVERDYPDASGLAEGFGAYRDELRQRRVVDFDEQIYRAIEILVADRDARSRAQESCRRMLVDEFQDLTPAHLLLIRLLCAPAYNCFGVGDDDQVIYGYSGANPGFLIHFDRYFPGAGSHALEVNYRCPPAVVTAATHLLSYNTQRVPKTIRTPAGREDPPPTATGRLTGKGPVATMAGAGEELAHVAVEMVSGWLAGGATPSSIAVLARVNSALLPVHVAFLEAGVPVSSPLGPAVLRRTGVRTALAYLRIAQDPERIRRADVVDTVHRPSRKISRMVVEMMTKRSTTSIAGIRKLGSILTGSDAPKLMAYAQDLEKVANTRTTAEALRTVRLGLGLGAQMEALDGGHGETDRSTHTDDLLAIEAVAALHPQPLGFEEWLTELLERPGAQEPAVLLSTVHKIKGKEWPKVLVLGANQELFPHRRANDEEGERRVFHVALTRALEQAVILFDSEAPSPFIAELDGARPHVPLQQNQDRSSEAGPSKKETRRGLSKPGAGESVAAAVGLELEVGGQRGAVVELRPMGALLRIGAARMEVAYGTRVLVGNRALALGAPSDLDP